MSSPERPPASEAADLAACRTLMRGGSRTFSAAAYLLPRRIRAPATALYAFCRLADDAIDEGTALQPALASLRQRLDHAYAGHPHDHPADRAFAHAVARHQVPRALPLALLEGFAWDAEGRRYATLDDLLDYAARVAGSVGAMMAVLMGTSSRPALARACDLGVAMQLTNIARDVGEDARAGRLYLPLDWLAEANLDPDAFLAAPHFSPPLATVIARLLQTADTLYASGATGIPLLPPTCRPGIRAAALIYADIGQALARQNHDSITTRAHVTPLRKTTLLSRSLTALLPAPNPTPHPPLPACLFLTEAAHLDPPPRRLPKLALTARLNRLFDLFERLHAQQWEVS